jgi:hypothetical protein
MNFNVRLIASACFALCAVSSQAQTTVNSNACKVKPTTAAEAEALVVNCSPAGVLFIGGASTQSSNLLTVLNSTVFDTTLMTPIEIVDNVTSSKANVKAFLGKTKTITNGFAPGSLLYVIYNYNNGSAGGVSQLLAKTPTLAEQSVAAKAVPEADVPFVGPAVSQTSQGGTLKNAWCGTTATGVTSTATKVACNSHVTRTIDMALSDVRAQELYDMYPAATNSVSSLTQVPLFLQSFGVAVSQPLYIALQKQNGLASSCNTTGIDLPECQPSIRRAAYASLVAKDGKIATLADLTGDSSLSSTILKVARRDDLSGTQAASNMFFVNGQCGGNAETAITTSIDYAVSKAGGLMGGLAIRQDVTDDVANKLDIQSNVTSTTAKTAIGSNTDYVIGVLGTGNGAKFNTYGRFVKIDGVSPNADGTTANYMTATATRYQIANGYYPFAYVMYGMYSTAGMALAGNSAKKATLLAVMDGLKSSALSDLAGIAYLDSSASNAVSSKQSLYSRSGGNNCAPIVKL